MSQIFTSSMGGGGGGPITQLDGNAGSALPAAGIINVIGGGSVVSADGISTTGNIWVQGYGNTLSITPTQAQYVTNYTIVAAVDTPYTALNNDFYISCSTLLLPITVLLPDNPTQFRQFLVKDRSGQAETNNITITTPGGTTMFEDSTTYILDSKFEAVLLTFNGVYYEAF